VYDDPDVGGGGVGGANGRGEEEGGEFTEEVAAGVGGFGEGEVGGDDAGGLDSVKERGGGVEGVVDNAGGREGEAVGLGEGIEPVGEVGCTTVG
jgi:hypothetical protein